MYKKDNYSPQHPNDKLESGMAGDAETHTADHVVSRRVAVKEKVLTLPKEVRNLIAGGIAGMVAKSVVAPIDRIKILYQVSAVKFRLRNVPKAAYSIVKAEGFTALWKGNLATMIRVFPYSGIQFMVFDRCKTHFLHKHEDDYETSYESDLVPEDEEFAEFAPDRSRPRKWGLTPFESLVSGSFAGAISVVATYPLDLTRAQLAVLKKKKHGAGFQGFVSVLTGNYRRKGVVGLFRGITPTVLGILPYSGIAFTINEQGKRKIQNVTGREPTTVERMQCGALSGLMAQTMTYPLEVTRRRMQTIGIVATSGGDAAVNEVVGESAVKRKNLEAASQKATPSASARPAGMINTMRDLLREQGPRGFFKGVSMNWMKGPIAFSISFTTFDIVQGLLETDVEKEIKRPRR